MHAVQVHELPRVVKGLLRNPSLVALSPAVSLSTPLLNPAATNSPITVQQSLRDGLRAIALGMLDDHQVFHELIHSFGFTRPLRGGQRRVSRV